MRKPLEQYNAIQRFFIGVWAFVLLLVMFVYVMVKTTYAKIIGKRYLWKSDRIE